MWHKSLETQGEDCLQIILKNLLVCFLSPQDSLNPLLFKCFYSTLFFSCTRETDQSVRDLVVEENLWSQRMKWNMGPYSSTVRQSFPNPYKFSNNPLTSFGLSPAINVEHYCDWSIPRLEVNKHWTISHVINRDDDRKTLVRVSVLSLLTSWDTALFLHLLTMYHTVSDEMFSSVKTFVLISSSSSFFNCPLYLP